jgi:kynurenine formamidase
VNVFELTMPLDYEWMPDELFPTATHFSLAPRGHPQKGMTMGIESGTCLLLPAQFQAFRKTRRLHEVEAPSLVLRPTVIVDVERHAEDIITRADLAPALDAADVRDGDALLLRTGWGEGAPRKRGSTSYVLHTPHLDAGAARDLADFMRQRRSDLLLTDMALISYPDKHLIPEWVPMDPRPLCYPSESAFAYLQGYLEREVMEDWEVDYILAEANVMTVKRLVNCGAIPEARFRVVVAPLRIIRGVGAPCRVAAVVGE